MKVNPAVSTQANSITSMQQSETISQSSTPAPLLEVGASQVDAFESGEMTSVQASLLGNLESASGIGGSVEAGVAEAAQPMHSELGQEFGYGVELTLGAYGIGDFHRDGREPMAEMATPPNVEGMDALELSQLYAFMASDGTQLNYPNRTVFLDRENDQMFLKAKGTVLTQAGSMDSTDHWYGPLPMPASTTQMTFSGAVERSATARQLSQGTEEKLSTPPDVSGLDSFPIPSRSYGGFIVDGHQLYNAKETAHVDAEKNQFYLEVKGDYSFDDAGFVPAADSAWFGPFPMFEGEPTSTVSVDAGEARVFESFDRMTSTVLLEGREPFAVLKRHGADGNAFFDVPGQGPLSGHFASLEEAIKAVLD
jgi:hypothetical protein